MDDWEKRYLSCFKCRCYTATFVFSKICLPCKRKKNVIMNPFNIGDIVSYTSGNRVDGTVKFIACGMNSCKKETCFHAAKDKVWVQWPTEKNLYKYDYNELTLQQACSVPSTLKTPITEEVKTETFPVPALQSQQYKPIESNSVIRTKDLSIPIKDDEIDWDVYMGYKRTKNHSYRKQFN